jgi:AAHS family 4-hydroxybenzoate transporter-like MFS transporter
MTSPDRAGPIGQKQRLAIGVIFCVLLFDGVDVQLLGLVTPALLKEWDVTKTAFAAALAAALVGMAIGSSLGGWIGDRVGRRATLIASTFLFGCATAATGLADGLTSLTILRLVSGLGFGAATPNAIALVTQQVPAGKRGGIVSVFSIGPPAGAMIASIAILWLLPTMGWRGTFFLAGGVTVLLGMLMFVTVPAYSGGRDREIATADHRGRAGLLDDRHRRLTIRSWAAFFCIAVVAYTTTSWSPVYLTSAGIPMITAVHGIISFTFASIITALFVGAWSSRTGQPPSLIVQILVAILGACTIAYLVLSPDLMANGWVPCAILVLMFLIGAMVGSIMATLYILAAQGYHHTIRATGVGTAIAFSRIGAICSVLVTGALLDLRTDGLFVHYMMIGALLVAVVAARLLRPNGTAISSPYANSKS